MKMTMTGAAKPVLLYEEADRQSELTRMKLLATSLFLLAAASFVVSSIFDDRPVWLGFVRAAAEAATVGAIADWFAVTAIFRHPLNLKIPHTAIIPTRKNSLGRTLGRFVKLNFLTPDVISNRLRAMQFTRRLTDWMTQPEHSQLLANYVAVGLATVVQVMKDEDIQELIEHNLAVHIRATSVAPLLGNLLSVVTSGNRQQELLAGMLKFGGNLLEEHKQEVLEKIGQETPWWLPQQVDRIIYQKIVNAFDETLREINADSQHPLHDRFNQVITGFIDDMKHSPDIVAKEKALKEELLQDPAVRAFSSALWRDLKASVIEYSAHPETDIRKPIQQGMIRFGETIRSSEALLAKMDQWLHEGAIYLVTEYGHEVEQLISQTISNWDADETSRRIELYVGKDLQFVRINGTLVGGFVGLVLHTVTFFLGYL